MCNRIFWFLMCVKLVEPFGLSPAFTNMVLYFNFEGEMGKLR